MNHFRVRAMTGAAALAVSALSNAAPAHAQELGALTSDGAGTAHPSRALASSEAAVSTDPDAPNTSDAFFEAPVNETVSSSVGDEGTAEIIVTAQRRSERAVNVPIAIVALSQDQLQTANVDSLADITKITPGLRFDAIQSFVQPIIRGVGTGNVLAGGGANVGIYLDGFYSPSPLAADMQLLNVSSIQVLKGPQGTLFGRNTTGGAILIQTADPSETTRGLARASYGRFNQLRLQGYATTGIAEGVAVDVEGLYSTGDGWRRNIVTGSKSEGDYANWTVRAGVLVNVSDDVSVLLRYTRSEVDDANSLLLNTYEDADVGVGTLAIPGTFTTDPDEYAGELRRFFRASNNVAQATIRADLGFADFTSYSQYRSEDVDQSTDQDKTALTLFQLGIPVSGETYSQELLLTSKSGGRVQWTAGAFYFNSRDTWGLRFDNISPGVEFGGSSVTTESYAAFADATYKITPSLFVTAGIRYSFDRVGDAYYYPDPTVAITPGYIRPDPIYVGRINPDWVDDVRDSRLTPRLVVLYKPTDRSSVYASYTQGYKAGILDIAGSAGLPVRPENIRALEVGYKYDDRVISFEAAAYHYDYQDLQVSLFKGGTSAQVINAASSEIYGVEAQTRYDVSRAFQVTLGGTWTHARYKHFVDAPVYVRNNLTGLSDVVPILLENVTMQRTPAITANAGARYRAELGGGELTLSGNIYYTSKFYFGPSGIQFPQRGYEVASVRAQWNDPTDRYTVALWGDNVTNSRYLTQVAYQTLGHGAGWSQPATYGVEFGLEF